MTHIPAISATASLIADPARAIMLTTLLDGRARPAGELAHACSVTAQTASSHLNKLLDGGLVTVETQGRHRYYRLAGEDVAHVLEHLAGVGTPRRRTLSAEGRRLRHCRLCYNHLAGQVGVALTRALEAHDYLRRRPEKQFEVTDAGAGWFRCLGLDIDALKPSRYGLARQCLDWTEREHHLAGPVGVALAATLIEAGWLRRSDTPRAVCVTPMGRRELRNHLALDLTAATGEPTA